MSTLFDTLVTRTDLANTTSFIVLGIQTDENTTHSLVRWQHHDDFFAFGYSLGALLRQHLNAQDALDVLTAFSTAALRALNDASLRDIP